MRFINYVCAAAIAVAAVGASSAALAQRNRGGGPIAVINMQRVLTESALGRDMNTKLQGVAQAVQTDAQALAPEGQSIEQEGQRLQQALRTLTPDQLRSNSQVQALAQRQQQLQQRASALEGDMQCSRLMAANDFNRQANPIIQTVATQRGASVVLDSGAIRWNDASIDITNAVIQQMDASARTSGAARHAVSECSQQAPAAAH